MTPCSRGLFLSVLFRVQQQIKYAVEYARHTQCILKTDCPRYLVRAIRARNEGGCLNAAEQFTLLRCVTARLARRQYKREEKQGWPTPYTIGCAEQQAVFNPCSHSLASAEEKHRLSRRQAHLTKGPEAHATRKTNAKKNWFRPRGLPANGATTAARDREPHQQPTTRQHLQHKVKQRHTWQESPLQLDLHHHRRRAAHHPHSLSSSAAVNASTSPADKAADAPPTRVGAPGSPDGNTS